MSSKSYDPTNFFDGDDNEEYKYYSNLDKYDYKDNEGFDSDCDEGDVFSINPNNLEENNADIHIPDCNCYEGTEDEDIDDDEDEYYNEYLEDLYNNPGYSEFEYFDYLEGIPLKASVAGKWVVETMQIVTPEFLRVMGDQFLICVFHPTINRYLSIPVQSTNKIETAIKIHDKWVKDLVNDKVRVLVNICTLDTYVVDDIV